MNIRYCIEFSKSGPARFLGHLDLQALFERLLRRAGLPLSYTQGFHQRVKIQFEEALPLGWSSDCERVWVELLTAYPAESISKQLRSHCPEGIGILRAYAWAGKPKLAQVKFFQVSFSTPFCRTPQEGFSIQLISTQGSAPSLKKVLKNLLGTSLPENLEVRRLTLEQYA
ncbi:MAG: TIGR03936 family radical SAM-associated protein [Planctomycetota bacterium]|nr:TIGR03936 family radical SAM-associated protein [Planctomycetota bacterium]